jgi:hypothetical protein
MQKTIERHTEATSPPPIRSILDLIVINAANLISQEERVHLLREIQHLATCTTRTDQRMRGLWLLIMTHTPLERQITYYLARSLAHWCQGVRAVEEQDSTTTARAALMFHQLHFPTITPEERASRILILDQASSPTRTHLRN